MVVAVVVSELVEVEVVVAVVVEVGGGKETALMFYCIALLMKCDE